MFGDYKKSIKILEGYLSLLEEREALYRNKNVPDLARAYTDSALAVRACIAMLNDAWNREEAEHAASEEARKSSILDGKPY